MTRGSERKEHLLATSHCQESCQTGRKKTGVFIRYTKAYTEAGKFKGTKAQACALTLLCHCCHVLWQSLGLCQVSHVMSRGLRAIAQTRAGLV